VRRGRHAGAVALCVGLTASTLAGAASPTVEAVVPGVGRIGAEFTVVLSGGRLKDARDLLLYDRGLGCTRLEVVSENEVRIALRASADARPGAHPFRLRTPGGLSELKLVHLTPFPVVEEREPNEQPEGARTVPLNTTIAGVIDAGDVDCVAVALRKGQRLAAEVQAVRLGGELTDTVLTILDPDGRPIAQADDTPITHQDPFATIVAPADGRYTVQVRETSYGGGPSGTYALHVGDFPRPTGVFPPGGQAGQEVRPILLGVPGRPAVQALTLPGDAGPWWDYFPALDGRTAPTPTALRVRPYPCVVESEPAGARPPSAGALTPHNWPVAFQGAIGARGEADAFAIRARAGQMIQVEAFAARIGSPLDTILQVFDPDGDPIARNDDDESHDSRIVFRAGGDGAYRIEIRDRRGEGGPGFLYRVEVELPRPSLALFLAGPVRKSQARQVIAVPRGNRVVAFLGVRRDGFDEPVRIDVGALPEGVSVDLKEIPGGRHLTPAVFEAAAEAPLGAALVELEGVAATAGGTVTGRFQQVVDLIPGPGDSSYASVSVGKLAVVVTEAAPYAVSLSAPGASLAQDGDIDLVATVERAPGFDEAIEVSLPYLPPGVEMEGPGIVPPGQSTAILRLFARPDADPTAWRLAAEAQPAPPRRDRREMTLTLMAQLNAQAAGGGAGRRRRRAAVDGLPQVASRFVPLGLTPAPVSGRFTPSAAEQGQTVTVSCTLESGAPRPGVMAATLEGLPPRAEAKPVVVAPGAHRVDFRVTVAPTTPVGEHATLLCRLTGAFGGRAVVYRVGRGGLLKVSPPGTLSTAADGKPLSPLEALRLKERAAAKDPEARKPRP
jgi:hypothetical protein